jgi:C4-dicarboxylate-specific signal transduction histidine kinase
MSNIDDRPRKLLIRIERDEGDRARLTVQEAGVGFDPAAADRLFESLYTTKNDGMGISIPRAPRVRCGPTIFATFRLLA